MTISEEEELERITCLLQRDNLIRGLGVVEFVYKLLHCTPGTGGPQKNCSLHHSVGTAREVCFGRGSRRLEWYVTIVEQRLRCYVNTQM